MSVTSETASVSYTGNNSTVTAYTVPFKFYAASHLLVKKIVTATGVETILAPTTGFTATGMGVDAGGSIKTIAAVDNTHTIRIERQIPFTQLTVFGEGQRIPNKVLEKALDWSAMQVQRLWTNIQGLVSDLTLKAPLASPALTGTPTTPTPALSDNSLKIANTAFVQDKVAGLYQNFVLEVQTVVIDPLKASGTITVIGNPISKTLTIGGVLYSFVGVRTAANQILLTAPGNPSTWAGDIVTYVNHPAFPYDPNTWNPLVLLTESAEVITIQAVQAGQDGNLIGLSTNTTNLSLSGPFLEGGSSEAIITYQPQAMPNLPSPAVLTLDGAYDITGLISGKTYLLTLEGTFDGATVTLTVWNDALGAYTAVDGGIWTARTEKRITFPSWKCRLTVTNDGAATSIAVTLNPIQ
jgi:hypothetical protein